MRYILSSLFFVGILACCSAAAEQTVRLPAIAPVSTAPSEIESPNTLAQAIDRQPAVPTTIEPLLQPPLDGELLPPLETPKTGVTLQELEQMALAGNPAIAQADARVRALRGTWIQIGLPPNPSVGYLGSEIGNEGFAGQQGGYVGQDFITGGKLRLNRAVVAQDILRAEQQLAAMRLRVQTDVRRAYYSALVAQRRKDLATELSTVSGEAVKASQELLKAEEIPQAGLLQTQVEQQNASILALAAQNEQQAAWRRMSAVVGTELPITQLAGDVGQLPGLLNWDEQLIRVMAASPEVAAALAELGRAQTALQRARVEPVPDINTQFAVQFDNATKDTIAGVQVGIPLPIWNRNQGGIRQAEAEIIQSRRNAQRVELNLKQRLAAAFQEFSTARSQAETYSTNILPKAKETFELVQRGYRLGELGYLDLLSAQRTYSQTNLAYLDALGALWRSWAEIEGLLLSDSLATIPQ